jgi:hypothetical protein
MSANTALSHNGTADRGISDTGIPGAWTAVVRDVRSLTVEVAEAGIGMTRRLTPQLPDLPALPGLPDLRDRWARTQDAVTRELKTRLDRLEAEPVHPHSVRAEYRRSPADLLDDLLEPAGADPETARAELYRALLLRLVPDEARLLAALADGSAHPLVHVHGRDRVVLANVTTAGTTARLALPDATGVYVAHLITLGLAEEGPEDESLGTQYDVLAGGDTVRAAEDTARDQGRGARVLRRTLRISPLGRSLWTSSRAPAADPAVAV